MVIFELFWSTGTGNLGLGMLVSHKRKSRCTCVYMDICAWVDAIHQNLPTSDSAHHLESLHNSTFHSTVMFRMPCCVTKVHVS